MVNSKNLMAFYYLCNDFNITNFKTITTITAMKRHFYTFVLLLAALMVPATATATVMSAEMLPVMVL